MTTTDSWTRLSQFFQMICIIGAISLLSWCYSEYAKNDDVVEVSFKKYGKDEDSIYPDVSLCFDYPFNEEILKEYDNALTKSLYGLFLSGGDFLGHWDERVLDIKYENVSVNLNDHIIGNALLFPATSASASYNNISITNFTTVGFSVMKCFTFHLPTSIKLLSFSIALRNSVFNNGIRPKSGFDIALHYPQQLIRSWQFFIRNWPIRTNMSSRSYQLDINVKDVEILKHRNKPKTPCSTSMSYDNDTYEEIVRSIGCIPQYLKIRMEHPLPLCKTKGELEGVANLLMEAFAGSGKYEHIIPPCKEVQRVGVDIDDTDFNITKILNGNDMDLNLRIPFILESGIENGKLY